MKKKVAKKNNGRPLKHLIVSFGGEFTTWEAYTKITQEIIALWPQFQVLAAIHRDVPVRPHSHLLIDCYDVNTGLKLSEGPNDFNNLIFKINTVLKNNNLPILLQAEHYNEKPFILTSTHQTTSEVRKNDETSPQSQSGLYMPYCCDEEQYNLLLAYKFLFPEKFIKCSKRS